MKIFSSVGGAWNAIGRRTAVLRREYVIEHYLRAGARFGDALAKLYVGECIPLDAVRRRFAQFERRYAALGFRTIKLDDFIEYGAYGKSLTHLLRIKRDASEAPIYHADVFEENYKQGFGPMKDFGVPRQDWARCGLKGPSVKGASEEGCDKDGCRLDDPKNGKPAKK